MSRDLSVDLLRGLNILEMETVESCDHSIFDHASFHEKKFNYADSIFPCFSFIVGMTSRRIVPVKRDVQLIGLGLCFNSVPLYIAGEKLRLPGVLQRHGLASIILNLIPNKNSYYTPLLLTSLWLGISYFFAKSPTDPFATPEDTAQHRIDVPVFGDRIYTPTFDPEGLLGALCTALTIWSGTWFSSQNFSIGESLVLGASLIGVGKLLSLIFPRHLPISKPLWTPTFVLCSSGWSILKYCFIKASLPYLPVLVISLLENVGKRSLEVYFTGEMLILLLQYKKQDSIWGKLQSKLSQFFNENVSRLILTGGFELSLVAFATFLVKNQLKLKLL